MFHFDFMIGISLPFEKEQERKKIFFQYKSEVFKVKHRNITLVLRVGLLCTSSN